jgi:protein AroM
VEVIHLDDDASHQVNSESTTVIGLVTIGQSPRSDITTPIAAALGTGFTLLEVGALDGLTDLQLAALAAGDISEPLATLLSNGQAIIVGADAIAPLLNQQADALTEQGAVFTVVLCTHGFPPEQLVSGLVQPCESMQTTVEQAVSSGNFAVVCPHEGQVKATRKQFSRLGVELNVTSFDPHRGDRAEQLASQFVGRQPDLVYLDCFSFSVDFAARLEAILDVPVYCPTALTAQLILNRIASS